jgi:hypothetical protein
VPLEVSMRLNITLGRSSRSAPDTHEGRAVLSDVRPSPPPASEVQVGPVAPRSPEVFINVAELPFLLTPSETATLLRTTQKAIYARAERGLLPGLVRDGRRILVRRDELLRSLSGVRASSPEGPQR